MQPPPTPPTPLPSPAPLRLHRSLARGTGVGSEVQTQSVISKVLEMLGRVCVHLKLSGLLGNIPSAYFGEGRGQVPSRGRSKLKGQGVSGGYHQKPRPDTQSWPSGSVFPRVTGQGRGPQADRPLWDLRTVLWATLCPPGLLSPPFSFTGPGQNELWNLLELG